MYEKYTTFIQDIEYNDSVIDVEVEFIVEFSEGYSYDFNGEGIPDYGDYEIKSIWDVDNKKYILERDLPYGELKKIDYAIELEISEL